MQLRANLCQAFRKLDLFLNMSTVFNLTKSWPLTGHWKSQGHYMPLPKYLQHQRLQKMPAFLMSRFARWLSASPRHAADTLTRRFRRSHLKTGFPLQNALIKTYMNSCSLVTNLCRSMALNPHLNFPSIFSTTRIPWLLNWFQWLVQARSPLKKDCPRVTRSWKSSRYSKIIKDLRLPKRLARWHPPSLSMSHVMGTLCCMCRFFSMWCISLVD